MWTVRGLESYPPDARPCALALGVFDGVHLGHRAILAAATARARDAGLPADHPALVKAAIGQSVGHEDLGGAHMHAAISGTIDFREPDEETCLARLRRRVLTSRRRFTRGVTCEA